MGKPRERERENQSATKTGDERRYVQRRKGENAEKESGRNRGKLLKSISASPGKIRYREMRSLRERARVPK